MSEAKSFFTGFVFDVFDESGNEILLKKFLEQSTKLIKFCDALGSTFFLTKKDVQGNINKIQEAMKSLPEHSTAKMLIEFELKMKNAKNGNSGTVGLLWLRRGLCFVNAMIENMIVEEREGREDSMKNMTKDAYERSLRPHHNAVMAPMIKAMFAALPRRSVLLKSLSNEDGYTSPPMDVLLEEMEATVASLRKVLAALRQLLIDNKQITDPSKDF